MTSATDELRRMLDEHGVPWKCYGYENHTWWGEWHAENRASVNGLFLKVEGVVTPEQAIAATLGSCNDSCNCTNGERTGERTNLAATLGCRTWSDFDVKMAYHMGYDDALAGRKPDAGKVVTDG